MIPVAAVLARLMLRSKAKAEAAAPTVVYSRPVTLGGLAAIAAVLAVSHGWVWYHTKQSTMANFALKARAAAHAQKRADQSYIDRVNADIATYRAEIKGMEDYVAARDEMAEKTIATVQKQLAEVKHQCGWAPETVDAINGVAPKPAPQPAARKRRR